jgi:hypothetical protein
MVTITFYGYDENTKEWVLVGETNTRLDIEHIIRTSKHIKFRYYCCNQLVFNVTKDMKYFKK